MRQRREVSAGPHRAFLRNYRNDSAIVEFTKLLNDLPPNTAKAEGKHVCPQQNHRTNFRGREWFPDTASMASDEVQLQLSQFGWRNVNVRQLAKTGVHSVDHATLRDDFLD